MTEVLPMPFRLRETDIERYRELRRRMLEDSPWAFEASPDDDHALTQLADSLGVQHNAIFAIAGEQLADTKLTSRGNELIAAAGISRASGTKYAHRARLWGIFVEPAYRGHGLGKAVMSAAIELARTWPGVDFIDLGVSENSPEARRLYERLGFQQWGREPEATDYDGQRFDEIYMSLRL